MLKNRDEREKVIDVRKRELMDNKTSCDKVKEREYTKTVFSVMVEVDNQSFPENQTRDRDSNPINDNNIIV